MPEETVVTPESVVDTPAVTPAPVYFGTDGTLNEGWMGTLPEGYRQEASLTTVKDAKVLAKMFVDTKRMVGKDTIVIPSDTSTEAEWSEYHKAGGRPETVEDYGLKAPEGFAPELSKQLFPADRLSKWQERFFKGGVSKKAADRFVADFAQDIAADIQKQKQAEEAQKAELVKGLSQDWGAAYDQMIQLGNITITEGSLGDFEFEQRVVAKMQKDPDLTRFAANIGKKCFAEGTSPNLTNIPTPSDIQTQINELMASPILTDPKSTLAQRKPIMDKVMALRAKLPVKTTP